MAALLPRILLPDPQNAVSGTDDDPTVRAGSYYGRVAMTSNETTTSDTRSPTSDNHMRQVSDSNTNDTVIAPSNRDALPVLTGDERPLSARSLDPMSEQILKRTGKAASFAPSPEPHEKAPTFNATPMIGATRDTKPSMDTVAGAGEGRPSKEKTKGAAFLARFKANKKKEPADEVAVTEVLDNRPEGAEAEEFFEIVDNMGFSPKYPQPPPYIKVRGKYKKDREFNRTFLAQHLKDTTSPPASRESADSTRPMKKTSATKGGSAIYGLEISRDGKYLASTGEDKTVRVWSLISSSQERRSFENTESASMRPPGHTHLSAPVFRTEPLRVFTGHEGAVLDLSWSKNNFLLSSSMDKTVRLWHVSRNECLCAFKHSDFVTSIQFHPKDDRFFLAGSLDSKLRLWSIPDKKIAFQAQLPDMVTAVAFTPDGKQSIAGCLSGVCLFYETENLRYQTQIHVKSRTGKNAKGSKVTGIQAMDMRPGKGSSDVKLLITSNDSRVRLYNLRDKSLEMKFKGHENAYSQNHARFSDDARHIICGSEDNKVYIWSTTPSEVDKKDKDKWPVEVFEAHSADTTVSLLAPTRTRQLLGASGDPIYDICNPPPVQLVSRSETAAESLPGDGSSLRHTSASTDGLNPRTSNSAPMNSPAYIARSSHPNGNIIITASAAGDIKIFRQDCAWEKRAAHSISEASAASASASHIKRTGSNLLHRSSLNTSRSRHSSANLTRTDSAASAASTQHPRDRILSWRQSIGAAGSTHSLDKPSPALSSFSFSTTASTSNPALARERNHQGRSASPRKSISMTRRGRFSRQSSAAGTPVMASTTDASPDNSPSESPGPATQAGGKNTNAAVASAANADGLSTPPTGISPARLRPPTDLPHVDSQTYLERDAWQDGIREQILAPPRMGLDGASDSLSVSGEATPSSGGGGGGESVGGRSSASASRSRSPGKRGLRLPGAFRGESVDEGPGGLAVSPGERGGGEAKGGSNGGGLGLGARLTNVLSGWSALTDGRSEGGVSEVDDHHDGGDEKDIMRRREERVQMEGGALERDAESGAR